MFKKTDNLSLFGIRECPFRAKASWLNVVRTSQFLQKEDGSCDICTNISDLYIEFLLIESNPYTHNSDTKPSDASQRSLQEPKSSFNKTMSVKPPNMTAYHSQDSNNDKVFYYWELVDWLSTKQLTWRLRAQSSTPRAGSKLQSYKLR